MCRVPLLGSGSDFAPFITGVGVTCIDMRYHFDDSLGISSYPLYHSVYETLHLYETFIDPTFKVWSLLVVLFIPLHLSFYLFLCFSLL